MKKLRTDIYLGFDGEAKPHPDHCHKYTQHNYETPQDFLERVQVQMADSLADLMDEGDDDED